MKKLKILISTIVCFSIIISILAFGEETTEYDFSDLKKYNIMVGDPDGNMRLDDNLTRAEAVKMILSAMGIKHEDTIFNTYEKSKFPDVWETHWAKSLINHAANIGIVKGDESGNFNPEKNITNEEFLKMVVVLLGYEPMAESIGGYPAGYLMVGARIGITDGLTMKTNAAAKRYTAAVMLLNSLDIPLMITSGFNVKDQEFQISDGSGDTTVRTIRTEFLDK